MPRHQVFDLDFSSNDYLGFSQHPKIIDAAVLAAKTYGVGSKASRMITSQQKQFKELEGLIAKSKDTQNSLLFATGYQANVSVLMAVLDPKLFGGQPPLVFSDRLNHASMHAACQALKIKQIRYNHLDADHLTWVLEKHRSSNQPKFILTE